MRAGRFGNCCAGSELSAINSCTSSYSPGRCALLAMPLSRRELLQAESERSHLVPRVEERNRTRSAGTIHAYSARGETNRATETGRIGGGNARASRRAAPRDDSAESTQYCPLGGVNLGSGFC